MASFTGDGKAIFVVTIGALITLALILIIADNVNLQTNTFTRVNDTVIAPAVNGTLDLLGREVDPSVSIFILNSTHLNDTIPNQNQNGTNIVTATSSTTGLRTVQLIVNDTGSAFAGEPVNVSYGYFPDGYLNNSGARSISTLIIIFSALAIMVFVFVTFVKFGSLGKLMGRK